MRLATNPLKADAEPWEPGNQAPFRALAGSQFVAANEDGTAVIRTEGGTEMLVYPGWLAVRAEGSPDGTATFLTPELVGEGAGRPWRVVRVPGPPV